MNYVKGIYLKKTKFEENPWQVNVDKRHFGKRIRERFKTKALAETAILKYENKLREKERVPLDPEIHKVIAGYQNDFAPDELREILETAVQRYKQGKGTIGEMGDRYLASKEKALELGAVSDKFVYDIKIRLPKAKAFFGNTAACDITSEMVTDYALWLKKEHNFAPTTIRNFVKKELSSIFHYAINSGFLTHNPVKAAAIVHQKPKVGILNAPELQQLLDASCHFMQVWFMFGAFGGLRSSEIRLVSWDDVDLDEGQFYVPGKKNVCAERYVDLTPPLKDFCKKLLEGDNPPEGLIMGGMTNASIIRRREKAMDATGIKIPRNALRHSFASHHLVHYNSPNTTAALMGHVGPQQTFTTYRRAVKKSQALIYWNVRVGKPLAQEPVEGRKTRWLKAA